MKLKVVVSAVLAAVMIVGCVSEQERLARAAAEEARRKENERQAQLAEIEKIKFSCDLAYLVDIAESSDVMEKRDAALLSIVRGPSARFTMSLADVPAIPRSTKVATDSALKGFSYKFRTENGITTMSVSPEMAKYGDTCIRVLVKHYTSQSSLTQHKMLRQMGTNTVSKALLEIARNGKSADSRMGIVKLAGMDAIDDGFVPSRAPQDPERYKKLKMLKMRYRQSLLMEALKYLAEKDIDANIRAAAAKRISEIDEAESRSIKEREQKSTADSTDVLKLTDMAKNNDDSELRLMAMSRLLAIREDSEALKQIGAFRSIKVEVDPVMKGLDSLKYGSRGDEGYIRISAEMAASNDQEVTNRIERIKKELAKKIELKSGEEKKIRAEISAALVDIAQNSKHADIRIKALEGIQDDRALLAKLMFLLKKAPEGSADAAMRIEVEKKIDALTLKRIANSSDKVWLAGVAKEYESAEVRTAAQKRIAEIKVEEGRLAVEERRLAEARRQAAEEALRRERDGRVKAIARMYIREIRTAYEEEKGYASPFPAMEGLNKSLRNQRGRSEKGNRGDWLAKWTEPRLDLSEENKLAGASRLEEFGTKFLPNAYANYEKVRDAAKELQQVFNEEFPQPWTIKSTDPKWHAFNRVLLNFASARTEFFFCHDELCHYWLLWRLGVLKAEELTKADSQKLAVNILPENVDLADIELLEFKPMEGNVAEFAAKYAPESYAIYQRLSRDLDAQDALLKDVSAERMQMDCVRFDRAWAAAHMMRNDIARELNALSFTLQAWRMDHRTAGKSSKDVARYDYRMALQLKPFVDSLPSYVKDRALGPVIPKADMVQIRRENYKIQRTEVTQIQWMVVMGNNPSKFKGADRPVENVSWNECQEFIKKVNEMDGSHYRLPIETEWENACRAGASFGDWGFRKNYETGPLEVMGWYDGNSNRQTHPVAMKEPNDFGLYDMHGNVWEWCEDLEHKPVRRGGSWYSSSKDCAADSRSGGYADRRDDNLGFRLAASLE